MTRLNARLSPDLDAKMELLKHRTKKTVTEIIRDAIEMYYQHTQEAGGAMGGTAFERSGFIGCANGEKNLSTDYKALLTDQLKRKTDPS